MWSRIHLIPMLQAEEDRDLVRRVWADQARERELLGRETKVYHSDRWVFSSRSVGVIEEDDVLGLHKRMSDGWLAFNEAVCDC